VQGQLLDTGISKNLPLSVAGFSPFISVKSALLGLAEPPQPRHPRAEQPRSGVAETLGSIP
jgi:hypothetical protein